MTDRASERASAQARTRPGNVAFRTVAERACLARSGLEMGITASPTLSLVRGCAISPNSPRKRVAVSAGPGRSSAPVSRPYLARSLLPFPRGRTAATHPFSFFSLWFRLSFSPSFLPPSFFPSPFHYSPLIRLATAIVHRSAGKNEGRKEGRIGSATHAHAAVITE